MREVSREPMESTYATASLIASTSRKSSFSAPATGRTCHVAPPSVVRTTVPRLPLAQAIRSETALTPRNRAVTPLDCGSHFTAGAPTANAAASRTRRARPMCRACLDFRFRRPRVALVGERGPEHHHGRVDDDDNDEPPHRVQLERLHDRAGHIGPYDATERQANRRAQAVRLLLDELQAADGHQECARSHHDRERGLLAHPEQADKDHARRIEAYAERHKRAEEEVARHSGREPETSDADGRALDRQFACDA